MQRILRFIGVLNAALWLGAAVFFTFVVGPAFFSPEMLSFLPRPYAGRAAEVIIERYFYLHICCSGVALLHVFVEYLHSGRPAGKLTVGLLVVLLGVGLAGAFWLTPEMHQLQRVKYSKVATPVQVAEAASLFKALHGASQGVNFGVLGALLIHFWNLTRPTNGPRFTNSTKLRS